MKARKLFLAMTVLFATVALFNACEEDTVDPCADVNCLNGGTCVDGDCDCAAGYEGDSCQILSRTKFLGNFEAVDTCTSSNYNVTIDTVTGAVDQIVLKEFGKFVCLGTAPNINATVEGDSLTIIPKTGICTGDEFSIDGGSGTISSSGATINLIYRTTYTGPQITCVVTLNRI